MWLRKVGRDDADEAAAVAHEGRRLNRPEPGGRRDTPMRLEAVVRVDVAHDDLGPEADGSSARRAVVSDDSEVPEELLAEAILDCDAQLVASVIGQLDVPLARSEQCHRSGERPLHPQLAPRRLAHDASR